MEKLHLQMNALLKNRLNQSVKASTDIILMTFTTWMKLGCSLGWNRIQLWPPEELQEERKTKKELQLLSVLMRQALIN